MRYLWFLISGMLCCLAPVYADAPALKLLSDNNYPALPRIETGASYVLEPAATNPADTTGKRLQDGQLPWGDWSNCVGWNGTDATVTFDLHAVYRVDKVELLLRAPYPKNVSLAVRRDADLPWKEIGTTDIPAQPPQPFGIVLAKAVGARYVRITLQERAWGFYLDEARIWGDRLPADMVIALPTGERHDAFPAVLTDNTSGHEPGFHTGVRYTAIPPFTNPADPEHHRLLDGDLNGNWNDVAGINYADQKVIFDFQGLYRFAKISVRFSQPQKPAFIEVSISDPTDSEFLKVGTITPGDRTGWYDLVLPSAVTGRYLKLFCKLNAWGWYINEVKAWGASAREPDTTVALPPVAMKEGKLPITRDGRALAGIVIAADAGEKTQRAARILQQTVLKMSGVLLPLRDDARDWAGAQICIGPSKFNALTVAQGVEQPDGYRVVVNPQRVMIVGNDAGPYTGSEYGVYDLLEQLGCGWFAPNALYQVIPRKDNLGFALQDRHETPAMQMRSVWNVFPEAYPSWRLQQTASVDCGHALSAIIPPEQYFADHPEYFAQVNGKRVKDGQLCFANADVQRIAIEKANAFFTANPDKLAFSLSPNDTGGFCDCADCQKLGPSPAARMLAFANCVARGVANAHPGKMVCFLAYWFTQGAPVKMRAEPNVIVMVVNEGCHAHALDDPHCERNVNWRKNFEQWAATGAAMAIYEWYIPGCNAPVWQKLPWISTEVAYRNLRYWRAHKVRWITYESQTALEEAGTAGYPRRWPLYYLAARGLWNPDADPRAVLREACGRLYGPAGDAMFRYFAILDAAMMQGTAHSGIWALPPAQQVYPPAIRARARAALGEALAAAGKASDRGAWQRVYTEAKAWQDGEAMLDQAPTP